MTLNTRLLSGSVHCVILCRLCHYTITIHLSVFSFDYVEKMLSLHDVCRCPGICCKCRVRLRLLPVGLPGITMSIK